MVHDESADSKEASPNQAARVGSPRLHLSLVTLVVADYDEAIDFYVNSLGFELREDTPQGTKRWVVVAPPHSETGLLLARTDGAQQASCVGNQTGGRVGWFLTTDDFERDHARMIAAGVTFLERPRHEPYGTVAVFQDLYGNRWDLIEPKLEESPAQVANR